MSDVSKVGGSSAVQYGTSVDGTQQVGQPPALLPEPGDAAQFNGDVMAHLAELLTKANQTDKRMSRDLENKANRAQAEADKERIADMRAKAEADKSAGLAEGWGSIVAGGLTLGSAVCSGFDDSQSATDADRTCGDTKPTGFKGWAFGAKGFDAGAKLATGGAKLISTGYKNDGDEANVQATSAENASRAAERAAKNAHDDVQDAREAIKKVAEFLDKMQQAANASQQTAATFRA